MQRLERNYQEWINNNHEGDCPPQKTQRQQLQESVDLGVCRQLTFEDVVDYLRRQAIDVQITDKGWSLKHGGIAFGGYQLRRDYTLPRVKQRVKERKLRDTVDFSQRKAVQEFQKAQEESEEVNDVSVANEISNNDLIREEGDTIIHTPKKVENYAERINGESLIRALQTLSGEEFEGTEGKIRLGDQSSGKFKYEMKISRSFDGTQTVIAHQLRTDEEVLNATISEDNATIDFNQASLPTSEVNSFVVQAQQVQEKREREKERPRRRQRQQQRQLTLNDEELSL